MNNQLQYNNQIQKEKVLIKKLNPMKQMKSKFLFLILETITYLLSQMINKNPNLNPLYKKEIAQMIYM